MQKYIEIVKKELTKYMSITLERSYNKSIFEEFMQTYIKIRYYNSDDKIEKREQFRKTILNELENQKKSLMTKYDNKKVDNTYDVFEQIIYLDNVGKYQNVQDIIDKLVKIREEKLNKNDNKEFIKNLKAAIKEYSKLKTGYLNKFDVEYFRLKNKKITGTNLSLTSLGYNIKFPATFKKAAIQAVYKEKAVREDRMLVEYNMVKAKVIRDIIKGEFNQKYLVEFETSVLSKGNKTMRTLNTIENEAIMERVNLVIEYKEFTEKTKEDIYKLMRNGYKIIAKIDDSLNLEDEKAINNLDVFSYILVENNSTYYNKLKNVKKISKKIIGI